MTALGRRVDGAFRQKHEGPRREPGAFVLKGGFVALRAPTLLLQDDDLGAAVLGHLVLGGVLDRVEVALRADLDLGGGDSDGLEILTSGGGATIAEAEVVFSGAAPVAVALEQQAVVGVFAEILLRFLKLGALAGIDGGAIEVEVHRLDQTLDHVLVFEHAGAILQAGGRRIDEARGAEIGCARVQRTCARTLAEDRVAGRRTLRLLRAAREQDGAGEEGKGKGFREEFHDWRRD